MPAHPLHARQLRPALAAALVVAGPLAVLVLVDAPARGAEPGRCDGLVTTGAGAGAGNDATVVVALRDRDSGRAEQAASGLEPVDVVFRAGGQPDGAVRVSPTWLEVPGQGTWTIIDARSGDVVLTPEPGDGRSGAEPDGSVFTPEGGYAEAPSRTSVPGPGSAEEPAPALRVLAPCRALALPDAAATEQGVEVGLRPLANDVPGRSEAGSRARMLGSSLAFDEDALPERSSLSEDVSRLRVAGEGVWALDGRTVVFAPEPGFTGRVTPVRYVAGDSAGQALASVMRVDVGAVSPTAEPDTGRADFRTATTLEVLANDQAGADEAPLVPRTLRLVDADGEDRTDQVVVDGVGVWTVTDDRLDFTPAHDFSGTTDPVDYVVADANGTRVGSTAQVAVRRAPDAVNDRARTPYGTPVRLDVLGNDIAPRVVPLVPATLRLVGPDDVRRQRLAVRGEGVWTVVDDELRFRPADGFSGPTTPVVYRVLDAARASLRARAVVDVEEPGEALPTEAETTRGTTITVAVLDNVTAAPGEELRPRSVCVRPARVRVDARLLKSDGDSETCVDDHRRSGVGRWKVDDDGAVTFTPRGGFTGRTVIGFRVADTGGTAYPSTLTVEVAAPPPAPDPTIRPSTGPPLAPVTGTTPTGAGPTGGVLPDTGGPTVLLLVAGLGLLAAGGLVVRRARRRT